MCCVRGASLGCPVLWAVLPLCGLDVVLIKDYSVVAQLCVCGDGRVERVRLGSQAVSGKMGRLCPSPVLQAAGAFGEGKPRLELCDEPQRRLRESGFCLLSFYPFVPFIGEREFKVSGLGCQKSKSLLGSTHFPFLCFVSLRSQAHHCLFPLVSREVLFLGP